MSKKPKQRVDPIEVFCRLRPLANDTESCVKILDDFNLLLQLPESSSYFKNGQMNQYIYSFAQIFDEDTGQKDVYEQVCLPLVQDLLGGKNGALFTYGVTGSGKTHTMTGSQQELGLLPRCLETIFNSISLQQTKKCIFKSDRMNSFEVQSETDAMMERQKRDVLSTLINSNKGSNFGPSGYNVQAKIQRLRANGFDPYVNTTPNSRARADAERLTDPNGKLVVVNEDHFFAVFVTCVEIYNNYIYDLLEDTEKRIDNSRESKMLKEDGRGSNYVKDVTEVEVKSTEEALELMYRALNKRQNGSNGLNEGSSRSHFIFTIRVVQAALDTSDGFSNRNKPPIYVSQLSLVDLAGSERSKRTNAKGARIVEAGGINQSLMSLRNCMEILRENIQNGTRKMVPYRDTKLTQLFKNYFEGNGKIKMVLCVNPSAVECDETISVLKFSETVRDVLIPVATTEVPAQQQQQRRFSGLKASSLEALEQANAFLLANLQQNNFAFMHESFPTMEVLSPDDDATIPRLIDYLEQFQRKREAAIHETDLLKQQLYIRLRELEDENNRLRDERNELQRRLDTRDKDQQRFEMKIKALEKVINTNTANRSTPVQQSANKENRFATPGGGGSGSANGGSGLGSALITSNNSSANNSRDKPPMSGETPIASTYRSSRITTTTTQSIGRNVIFTAHNSASGVPPVPVQTPSSACRVTTIANSYNSQSRHQSPMRQPQAPPTPMKESGVPVANKRAMSRRSRSADMWLDHKPPTTTKTETVLQPKLTRKKSVSKLELSDAKKSSKYVLTHQEQDDEGEIVTNLIKGDILKSPSGGANVVFTDIETLKSRLQEIPKSHRHRGSTDCPVEDRATIEERVRANRPAPKAKRVKHAS